MVFLALSAVCAAALPSVVAVEPREGSAFIDWENLRNPVLSLEDRMVKDASVVYREGWFYLFASMRLDEGDTRDWGVEWRFYRSRDLKKWDAFQPAGLRNPRANPASPDVTTIGGKFYMAFQWPDAARSSRLFWSLSADLENWTPARELAPRFRATERVIDGALAEDDGYFYLGAKATQDFYVTRSRNRSIDGEWLPPVKASAAGEWAENFQFLKIDGVWRMVATDGLPAGWKKRGDSAYTSGHEPFIYTMAGDGSYLEHWAKWVEKSHLNVPFESWNTMMHANSGFLCDWRRYDGYFYLFYAGSVDDTRFARRGHGKIGVARSRDLKTWRVPGDMRP